MNNLTKFVSVLLALMNMGLFATSLYGQGNNNTISLAPHFWFQNGGTIPLPTGPNQGAFQDYDGSPAEYTHASVQDENGDLLFFVVDGSIYDSEGYLIKNLFVSDPQGGLINEKMAGVSETLIVPDPFNCYRYYIFAAALNFTTPNTEPEWFPFYTVLDLSLESLEYPNRYGAIDLNEIPSTTGEPLSSFIPDFFSTVAEGGNYKGLKNVYFAAPKQVDCSNKQFVYMSTGVGAFQFEITENGLVYNPDMIELPSYTLDVTGLRGEMEVIELPNKNHRLAFPYHYKLTSQSPSEVAIYSTEFDQDGLVIPSTEEVIVFPKGSSSEKPFINGLEFSPNGEKLFFTHNITSSYSSALKYFDFNNQTAGIQNLNVSNNTDFQKSQIETSEDGDLIFATQDRLAALSNSDNPISSNWTNLHVPLNFNHNSNNANIQFGSSSFGFESYIISKQIKQRSYSDYLFELGCASSLNDPVAFDGIWSPGLNNNPFNSVSGEVYIDFDIIVPEDATLSIQNMKLHFAEGRKIIVKRGNGSLDGAVLNVTGSTLTVDERCSENTMWQGIEVHGYPNQPQNVGFFQSHQHGIVNINNSTIEHAYIGVGASSYSIIPNPIITGPSIIINSSLSYNGGVIRANNSEFKNNLTSMDVRSYTFQDNESYAELCEFITAGELNKTGIGNISHVKLDNVLNVELNGNEFICETPELYSAATLPLISSKVVGVKSHSASFKVDIGCITFFPNCQEKKSYFEGLTEGVNASSSNSSRFAVIDKANFYNNHNGVIYQGMNDSKVLRSNFKLRTEDGTANLFGLSPIGVRLDNSTGYEIEENSFTEYLITNGDPVTIGVLVNESGEDNNEIYRNSFEDITIGVQAQGINAESYDPVLDPAPSNKGLQIKCNTFNKDIFEADIAVTSGRINYHQGYCLPTSNPSHLSAPAGNKFSHSGFNPTNDISVNSGVLDFQYAHHVDNITTPQDYSSNKVVLDYCADLNNPVYFDNQNSCPVNYPNSVLLFSYNGELDELVALNDSLKAIKSNQNNDLEIESFNLSRESDMETLKNQIIDKAPYISNENMNTFFSVVNKKEDLIAVLSVYDVINYKMYSILEERSEELSITNKDLSSIYLKVGEMTLSDKLDTEVNLIDSKIRRLSTLTLSKIDYDTTLSVQEKLNLKEQVYSLNETKYGKIRLADFYFNQGKYLDYEEIIDSLHQSDLLTTDELSFYSLKQTIYNSSEKFRDTIKNNNEIKENIEHFIESESIPSYIKANAQSLYSTFYDSTFYCNIETLNPENIDLEGGKKATKNPSKEDTRLKSLIYPNPSRSEFVYISVPIEVESYQISIIDASGSMIKTVSAQNNTDDYKFHISNIDEGIYFIKLHGKNINETHKIIIQ